MSWMAMIPYVFQILGFVLERVKANNDTIAAFKRLVDASQANGLISVQASDKFATLHDKLMARLKEKPPTP